MTADAEPGPDIRGGVLEGGPQEDSVEQGGGQGPDQALRLRAQLCWWVTAAQPLMPQVPQLSPASTHREGDLSRSVHTRVPGKLLASPSSLNEPSLQKQDRRL